ncbi:MAG: beta-lactamase family protein [Kiritimatiellales bacterium]|nr:beta-lactamase family protein [Kiritimatiellales bacterium]MCF7864134.1 beta-lactamase family protein [Kiritimatiellales bacterium]
MTHGSSGFAKRRTFIGTASLAAFSLRTLAKNAAEKNTGIIMPSAFFGSVSPVEAGFREDVAARVVSFLQAQIDAGVIPGAFVAAMRHGKVFLEAHLGTYCNRVCCDAPYDGAAIHPFHSISKMVSATAVVMAWQDGLINLDAPVMKYIPEFGCGGKEVITIRQLLNHSAGIPQNPPEPIKASTEKEWEASIAAICAEPVQWEPGSRTQYHALSGLLIAAEAVRRASDGKPWEQICRERIFHPLGLSSFTFGQPPADLPLACIPRLSSPTAQWQIQINGFYGQPAAGLKGSFTDVLKFLVFQTRKGVWDGKALLREKFWNAMHTPQFPGKPDYDSWGLGMLVRGDGPVNGSLDWFGLQKVKGLSIFSHAGTDVALAVGDPDTDVQIVFMVTNKPTTPAKTIELRGTVTGMVFDALSRSV